MLIETREDEQASEQGRCSRSRSLHAKRASFGHPLLLSCTTNSQRRHPCQCPSCIVSVFASRNLPYSPASTNTKSPVTLLLHPHEQLSVTVDAPITVPISSWACSHPSHPRKSQQHTHSTVYNSCQSLETQTHRSVNYTDAP